LVVFAVRNYQNLSEKCQKCEKIQVRSDDDIFFKFRQNAQILKSQVSVSNFVSSLGLGVFDEASVSKFQPGPGLEGYGLSYITVLTRVHSFAWSKLEAHFSGVGLYCVTIPWQQIFKGSLQVAIVGVLRDVAF